MKKLGIFLLAAILIAALLLGGCASNTSSEAVRDNTTGKGAQAAPATAPAAVAPSVEEAGAAASDQWGISNMENGSVVVPSAGNGLKMVYTSQFDINSSDYDADYQKIKDLLKGNQGYIETETSSGQKPTTQNTSGRISNFVLRVPVTSYENFLNGIVNIGKLQSKNLQAQDISGNYYDNEARIQVLEEREAKLNEYLKSATNMQDEIALEKELSDVLYQLDQLKGTKRGMDKQIDYASVSVNLNEVPDASKLGSSNVSVSEQASKAFSMSWIGVGNFLNGFAVFMAAAFPVIVLLLVILAIVFGILYAVRKIKQKVKTQVKK
ncbi:MAG: DUF4349 domain-containing protein [Eubacteriales bacterium]